MQFKKNLLVACLFFLSCVQRHSNDSAQVEGSIHSKTTYPTAEASQSIHYYLGLDEIPPENKKEKPSYVIVLCKTVKDATIVSSSDTPEPTEQCMDPFVTKESAGRVLLKIQKQNIRKETTIAVPEEDLELHNRVKAIFQKHFHTINILCHTAATLGCLQFLSFAPEKIAFIGGSATLLTLVKGAQGVYTKIKGNRALMETIMPDEIAAAKDKVQDTTKPKITDYLKKGIQSPELRAQSDEYKQALQELKDLIAERKAEFKKTMAAKPEETLEELREFQIVINTLFTPKRSLVVDNVFSILPVLEKQLKVVINPQLDNFLHAKLKTFISE